MLEGIGATRERDIRVNIYCVLTLKIGLKNINLKNCKDNVHFEEPWFTY